MSRGTVPAVMPRRRSALRALEGGLKVLARREGSMFASHIPTSLQLLVGLGGQITEIRLCFPFLDSYTYINSEKWRQRQVGIIRAAGG